MPIHELRKTAKPLNLLLFVHGFGGNIQSNFGPLADALRNDPKLDSWDIYGFSYTSTSLLSLELVRALDLLRGFWKAEPRIPTIALQFKREIELLASQYERTAIVAHSMGGLVVQQAILDSAFLTARLNTVICMGTPSNGLEKAAALRVLKYQIRDMAVDGPYIKSLREAWSAAGYLKYTPFDFLVVAGDTDDFVPIASSLSPFPKKFQSVISGDHSSMLLPSDDSVASIIRSVTQPDLEPPPDDSEARRLVLLLDRKRSDAEIEYQIESHKAAPQVRPYLFLFPAMSEDLPTAYVDRLDAMPCHDL